MFRRKGCYVLEGRRCFNCLQPGHESSSCEAPRTTETKQCYNCGGQGHIKQDCPSIDNSQCYGCGGKGHVKANCPSVGLDKCYGCGGTGHVKANCATVKNGGGGFGGVKGGAGVRCRRCNGPNHGVLSFANSFARDCKASLPTNSNGAPARKPKTCYSCNQTGHIAKECPKQQQTQVEPTTMAEAPGSNAAAALTA
ncbi:related to GIS2 - Putative zinc finger protein, proposed to be involved in the RAS/cAMP signaling pathway [Ustilago trichophora]|uniref:Related to GIS2 - Putative zinc finger protein, proposed to be involved in the RAS/cAMP signaling pathway n=1 Tax=Ustilago trichophora TaxID=86804 RepID=A0A5C3DVL9_9BASI|nr:related to GIS2 - Putative zinc finger protein, proposed to be involved in the RAS/cAMP signaling pathway [Ustilago trichophora]